LFAADNKLTNYVTMLFAADQRAPLLRAANVGDFGYEFLRGFVGCEMSGAAQQTVLFCASGLVGETSAQPAFSFSSFFRHARA
jgi:hypothetical protein